MIWRRIRGPRLDDLNELDTLVSNLPLLIIGTNLCVAYPFHPVVGLRTYQ